MFRRWFVVCALAFAVALAADLRQQRVPFAIWCVGAVVIALGTHDLVQRRHALLRNYPVIGRFRYLSEVVRPELRQYFGESDTDGVPFDRELRSLVYRRAKGEPDTVPFGTKRNLAASGVEWVAHSMYPVPARKEEVRVSIGAGSSSARYACSRLNVAAMSYGALSGPAIRALSEGAGWAASR